MIKTVEANENTYIYMNEYVFLKTCKFKWSLSAEYCLQKKIVPNL